MDVHINEARRNSFAAHFENIPCIGGFYPVLLPQRQDLAVFDYDSSVTDYLLWCDKLAGGQHLGHRFVQLHGVNLIQR